MIVRCQRRSRSRLCSSFLELGQREFALADLAVDLRVELGAVGDELCPFLTAFGSEQFRQSLLIAFRPPGRGQHYHLAVSALSHRYRTVNPFGERSRQEPPTSLGQATPLQCGVTPARQPPGAVTARRAAEPRAAATARQNVPTQC